MHNPILSELVARERFKDYHKEAEQIRLVKAVTAQPSERLKRRISLGNLLIAIRQIFKALAHAE